MSSLLLVALSLSAASASLTTKLNLLVASSRVHRNRFPLSKQQMLNGLAMSSQLLGVSAELEEAICSRATGIYDMNTLHRHVADCVRSSFTDPRICVAGLSDKAMAILKPAFKAHRSLPFRDAQSSLQALHDATLVMPAAFAQLKHRSREIRKFSADTHFQQFFGAVTKFFFEITSVWEALYNLEIASFDADALHQMTDQRLVRHASTLMMSLPASRTIVSEMLIVVGSLQQKYSDSVIYFHQAKSRGVADLVKMICSLALTEALINTAETNDDFFFRQFRSAMSALQQRRPSFPGATSSIMTALQKCLSELLALAESRQRFTDAQTSLMQSIGPNTMTSKYTYAQLAYMAVSGAKLKHICRTHAVHKRSHFKAERRYVIVLSASVE